MLRVYQFSKENCIVIEDSANGIQAAVSAEIFALDLRFFHSKDQDLSKANLVIRNFNELNFESSRFELTHFLIVQRMFV